MVEGGRTKLSKSSLNSVDWRILHYAQQQRDEHTLLRLRMNTDANTLTKMALLKFLLPCIRSFAQGEKLWKVPTQQEHSYNLSREKSWLMLSRMSKGKAADDSGIVAEMLKQGNKALLDAIPEFVQWHCGGWPRNSKQVEDDTFHGHIQERQRKTSFQLQTDCNHTNPLQTFQSNVLRAHSNHTYVTAIFRSSSVPCWIQHRRPFVDSNTDDGTVQWMALGTLAWAHWFWKSLRHCGASRAWDVLKDQGLHSDYIDIIKRLYDGQTAYVQAGAASRRFPLLRGVKQEDPVSALLFIAVMEQCFRSLKKRWKSTNRRRSGEYFGIVIDDPENTLSNLRFADDILLFANSSPDLTKMIAHLRDESAKYGLRMHLGKTKILSNIPPDERPESLKVGATSIEVLKEGVAEKYLGRKLTLDHYHATELANKFQLVGPRSRSIRLHCVIKGVIFVYDWNCLNPLSHLLFSTDHHAGRCGRTETPANQQGEECWGSLWEWDAVQMKRGWNTHKVQPGAAKSSLQSTDCQTGAISSINANSRWCRECRLCSRTDGRPDFWNGHHGFAQFLREVRVVPKSDGVIQRICKNSWESICLFSSSFLSKVGQSHHWGGRWWRSHKNQKLIPTIVVEQYVRMGDFKDGLQRWTVRAHEQWRQIGEKIQGALQRALFDQFRGANAASSARAWG